MQKKNFFYKFAKKIADSKSRAQELSNNVSFVIFGHQTWNLEGGGQIDPPLLSRGLNISRGGSNSLNSASGLYEYDNMQKDE